MPARELPYPVFDADNHFYEPKEALTQFLPEHRKGVIDYIDVRGRTKIMVRNVVSDYIPNPTFEVVARPGAQEEYFRHGSGGKSFREVMGKPMKAIPAFRDPAARLEVMDSLGLDYTLMFPTLASLVEERLKDDPELILDIVHALNEWMYETWQFNYENRIFSTPVVNLGVVDRAIEELEWCLERGAKTVLVRPAPVPGLRGTRSFGTEEFDPFWQACVKAGIPVSMHASDSGYSEYLNDWEPGDEFKPFAPTSFRMVAMGKRPIEDTMAALVCHGALTRNPDLRILSIENGADWVPYLFKQFKNVYSKMPQGFLEDPIEAFRRCVYVAPFWEDDFAQMAELCGVDRVIFGSDWPHPEGLAEPTKLIDDLQGLDEAGSAKGHGWQHDRPVQDSERGRSQAGRASPGPQLITPVTDTNPEVLLFASTTQSFLEKEASLSRLRELHAAGTSFDHGWWRRAAELGWTSLLVPEELGGGSVSGDGVADLALVAELAGKTVAPGPLHPVSTVLAGLVEAPENHEDTIESLVSGETVAIMGGVRAGQVVGADETRCYGDTDRLRLPARRGEGPGRGGLR